MNLYGAPSPISVQQAIKHEPASLPATVIHFLANHARAFPRATRPQPPRVLSQLFFLVNGRGHRGKDKKNLICRANFAQSRFSVSRPATLCVVCMFVYVSVCVRALRRPIPLAKCINLVAWSGIARNADVLLYSTTPS